MIIDSDQSNPHEEPCLKCGEETAIGSVFYSDRREVQLKDGAAATCAPIASSAFAQPGITRV